MPDTGIDFDFLTGAFDPVANHSRASIAYQFDSTGKFIAVPHNLFFQSGDLTASGWSNSGAGVVATKTSIIAPDGVGTWTELAGGGVAVDRRQSKSIIAGQTYTMSIYAKRGNQPWAAVSCHMTGGTTVITNLYYNFDTDTITSSSSNAAAGFTHSRVAVGGGVYRLMLTQKDDGDGTTGYMLLHAKTETQVLGATCLYWGAQMELHDSARPYLPTTTTSYYAPAFDYDPASLQPLGLRIETARTQSIRNSAAAGAVAGTPGTLPTNWGLGATTAGTVATQIIGTGTDSGIPYVDVRYFGTPAGVGNIAVRLETSTGIAAVTGATLTTSAYLKVQSGSLGAATVDFAQDENTSAGAFVAFANSASQLVTGAALNTQRYTYTRTLSGGATVGAVRPMVRLVLTGTTAIDVTLRIGLPQLEQGSDASSVLLTNGAAATRAADTVTEPANPLDPKIGLSRTSLAWRFDALGRYSTAPHNLVLWSEDFGNAVWVKTAATVVANNAVAPDGTTTADTITFASGSGLVRQSVGASAVVNGTTYTFAIYMRLVSGSNSINFDINDGSGVNQTVTTSWSRVTVTLAAGAGSGGWIDFRSNAAAVVEIWGAQLEQHRFARDYYPTTSAAYHGPAWEFDPLTLAPLGLRIEGQNTNLLTTPNDFSTGWTVAGTVTQNNALAPDGTLDADLVTVAVDTGTQYRIITVSPSTAYVWSYFVKLGTKADNRYAVYDHTNAAFIVNNTIAVGPNSANWTRISVPFVTPATCTQVRVYAERGAVASLGTVWLWGGQVETGTMVSSFIPGNLTRAADTPTINAPLADWYNQDEGTMVVEVLVPKQTTLTATGVSFGVSDGLFNNSMYLSHSTGFDGLNVLVGGVSQCGISNVSPPLTIKRIAAAYKLNDFAISRNGGSVSTDASGTLPVVTQATLGRAPWTGGSSHLYGYLRRVTYRPTRRINSDLQALSAAFTTVGLPVAAPWNTQQVAARDIEADWNAVMFVASDGSFVWDERIVVGRLLDSLWNSSVTVGASAAYPWDDWITVGQQGDFRWAGRSAAGQTLDCRWNTIAHVEAAFDLRWNTLVVEVTGVASATVPLSAASATPVFFAQQL